MPPGIFTVAASNAATFGNAVQNDVVVTTTNSTQNVLVGPQNAGASAGLKVSTSGIVVATHVVPDTSLAYDLGTSNLRFRDLYLSGNTINLGGATIGKTTDGSISLMGTDAEPVRLIVKEVQVSDTAASSNVLIIRQNPDTGDVKIVKATQCNEVQIVQDTNETIIKNLFSQSNYIAIGDSNPARPFQVNNTFAVTSSGVGINVLNPTTALHVAGSAQVSAINCSGLIIAPQIGLGTTNPSGTIHVVGDVYFTGSLLRNGVPFSSGSSLSNLITNCVAVANSSSNVYTPSGFYWDPTNSRLGVGTASPQFPLHVNGFAASNTNNISIFASHDISAFSDARFKTDLEVIPDALSKVSQITGYTFDRIPATGKRMAGVLAQEVQQILPEVVNEDGEGHLSVAYGNMVALLINAIKELKTEVDELKAKAV